jgi:two-component system phosphate regulon sensor histidine kinase PhoR
VTLAGRLLGGAVVVLSVLVAAVVLIAGSRLRDRLVDEKLDELRRDAHLVSTEWTPGVDAEELAHRAGRALGYRVTIVDSSGVVLGDSEFEPDARRRLENHRLRPEIIAAHDSGSGHSLRRSASAGDEEMYFAVRHPSSGFVRVSLTTRSLDEIVGGARRDVLVSGVVALLGVLVLVPLFARSISQPVVELRDVARAIAAGDLTQRPALSAPGEIGDLATALHRMSEQLSTRLHALEADDLLMTAVLESLEEGVFALDERGMVVRLNDRARMLLDVAAPVPFARELLPRDQTLRAALDQSLQGSSTGPSESNVHGRTVAIASRPLLMAGAVVTILDLTALRRLETIRRDFVANVSHELKTPLTAVSGFAETLLDEMIPADQRRKFVNTIRDNAGRMQRIVDDLLDLSRVESGSWHPRLGVIEVESVVDEIFAAMQPTAAEKGLALRAEISPEASRVQADSMAFRQVMTNLVENALRYTREGSVTVRTRPDVHGVWVDVHDTGIGIAADHLPRIFERFYRVDSSRSREQGGTGLGLAIVRHMVEAHGGRVEATSAVGRGTTISVLFPNPETA